jgi:hypothetical protein
MCPISEEGDEEIIEKALSEAEYETDYQWHEKKKKYPMCDTPVIPEKNIHPPEACHIIKVWAV